MGLKTLLDKVKSLPDARHNRINGWHVKFRAENPKLMEQIDELIDDYWKGKPEVRVKFNGVSPLAKFLVGEVAHCVGPQGMTDYIKTRSPNGKPR